MHCQGNFWVVPLCLLSSPLQRPLIIPSAGHVNLLVAGRPTNCIPSPESPGAGVDLLERLSKAVFPNATYVVIMMLTSWFWAASCW